jgi:HlyD family secretion protein
MSATADMYTETVFGGVAVPIQAVTVRDFHRIRSDTASEEGGSGGAPSRDRASGEDRENAPSYDASQEDLRTVIFVYDDGRARMREVATGIADETHMHVIEGVETGEQIIIGPYSAVSRELSPDDPLRRRDDAQGRGALTAQF